MGQENNAQGRKIESLHTQWGLRRNSHRRKQKPPSIKAFRKKAGFSTPGVKLWPEGQIQALLLLSVFPKSIPAHFHIRTPASQLSGTASSDTRQRTLLCSPVPWGSLRGASCLLLADTLPADTLSVPLPTPCLLPDSARLISVPRGPAEGPSMVLPTCIDS